MKSIIENVILTGMYDLTDMLKKIDTLCVWSPAEYPAYWEEQ